MAVVFKLLSDVTMPVLDGMATIRQLHTHYPQVRILMLPMLKREEPHTIGEALAAGAHGYVLKNANKQKVVRGIRTILNGRCFLCPETGLNLLDAILTKRAEAVAPAVRPETSLAPPTRGIAEPTA